MNENPRYGQIYLARLRRRDLIDRDNGANASMISTVKGMRTLTHRPRQDGRVDWLQRYHHDLNKPVIRLWNDATAAVGQ